MWSPTRAGDLAGGYFVNRGETVLGYGCKAPFDERGCTTLYAFEKGRLIGFTTRSRLFRTAAGSKVGDTLAQVRARKHGRWFGFAVQCRSVLLRVTSKVI